MAILIARLIARLASPTFVAHNGLRFCQMMVCAQIDSQVKDNWFCLLLLVRQFSLVES